MRIPVLVLPFVLTACAANACDRAARAFDACAAEAEASGDSDLAAIGDFPFATECSTYALPGLDILGDVAGVDELYNCVADAYENGDCSTAEGLDAASDAASGC